MTPLSKEIRNQFLIPNGTYMLGHSVGALPKVTIQGNESYLQSWAQSGGNAWPLWLEKVNDFRAQLALVLDGNSNDFCPQSNVSSGLSKFLWSLPDGLKHKKIVCTEFEYPTVIYVIQQMQRAGYEVEILKGDGDGCVSLDRWSEVLKQGVSVALVSHVQYGNSHCNPVAEFVKMCRDHNVISIIDIAQSAGVVPLSVTHWNADCVVGSCVKWLCGGPGAGFMWVNAARLNALLPRDVGWFSKQNPFSHDAFKYADSALRFWGGTPSVAPFVMAAASLKFIKTLTVEQVNEANQRLTHRLIEGLADIRDGQPGQGRFGINLPTLQAPRGGTVTLSIALMLAHKDQDLALNCQDLGHDLCAELAMQKIHVDFKAGYGVRISPHIYNTVAEIEEVISAVRQFLHAGTCK